MAVSKAQQKAQNKWIAKAYDRVNLTLPKGQKEVVQAHATDRGESVNGFIGRAILETMERESGAAAAPGVAPAERVLAETAPTGSQQPAETAQGGGGIPVSPDTLETAQRAADAAGETVADFIRRAVETQAKRDQASLKLGIRPTVAE